MRRSRIILFLFLVISFSMILTAFAEQEAAETVKCPVSGKEMKKSEAKATYEYNGKTYYFCCDNCKETFLKDPEKYAHQESESHEMHMQGHQHGEEMVADPVCGMKLKKEESQITYEYNGKTYYFCMEGCKEKFVKNPEKYVNTDVEFVTCPVSGEEFDKTKAAGSYELDGKTYYFCCEGCKERFLKDPEKYTKKK